MVDQKEHICYNCSIVWFLNNNYQERQTMNQYLKAGLMTATMTAICVAVAVFFQFLSTYVTTDIMPKILVALGISVCVFCIYSVFLAQVRYEDTVKRLVDKK
jgi:membrane protein YdbS with pleckstrin-like domain